MNQPLYEQLLNAGSALLQVHEKRIKAHNIKKTFEAEKILLETSKPEKEVNLGIGFLLIFFLNVFGIIPIIYMSIKYKKNLALHQELWQDYQERYEKVLDEINQLENDALSLEKIYAPFLEFLPKTYRNIKAVAFMLEAVHDGRADTLKEVMNLYEDFLHKEAVEIKLGSIAQNAERQNEFINRAFEEITENQRMLHSDLQDIKALQVTDMLMK